jgi:hypothetical protein
MRLKSERLKKLENEHRDLEQWLKLGLVPKKDIEKHKVEIAALEKKIVEEEERLRLLKENGEVEEFTPSRRTGRTPYQEPQSLPDVAVSEEANTETSYDMETESFDTETSSGEEKTTELNEDASTSQIHEEDPFSDKNRWKRGVLEDPDSDDW